MTVTHVFFSVLACIISLQFEWPFVGLVSHKEMLLFLQPKKTFQLSFVCEQRSDQMTRHFVPMQVFSLHQKQCKDLLGIGFSRHMYRSFT